MASTVLCLGQDKRTTTIAKLTLFLARETPLQHKNTGAASSRPCARVSFLLEHSLGQLNSQLGTQCAHLGREDLALCWVLSAL